jgi:hypothetical protein
VQLNLMPNGTMPMMVAVPGRRHANVCSAVRFNCTALKPCSTPPPVNFLMASTGSALLALTVSVAPPSWPSPASTIWYRLQ